MAEIIFNTRSPEIMSWPYQQPNYTIPIHQQNQSHLSSPPISGNLTQLPQVETDPLLLPHKRSSLEMEDDQFLADEPPTKQLLSENRLLRQFGSLNIDGKVNIVQPPEEDGNNSTDDQQGPDTSGGSGQKTSASDREEFNRYVYLLFKDRKTDGLSSTSSDSLISRLAREERDKLSKAVVLWSPPLKDNYLTGEQAEDSDDEEFRYKDHNDFKIDPVPQIDADGDIMME